MALMIREGLYFVFSAMPFLTCLWWAVTLGMDLFPDKKSVAASRAFFIFVLVSTLLYFCHFVHFNHDVYPDVTVFDGIWIFCTLAVYPLFGLWIRRLTVPARKLRSSEYAVFLCPALLMSAISFFLIYSGRGLCGFMPAVKMLFSLEVVLTLFFGIRSLRRFRRDVANYYSDTEGKELLPVRIMLVLLLCTSVFSLIFNVIGRELFSGSLMLGLPSCIFSVLLWSICHIGHKPIFDITDFQREAGPEDADTALGGIGSSGAQDLLLARIVHLMEEDRLYLKQGLTINDLASAAGSNRTYVSNCINRKLGVSFSDYVASYRVKAAIRKLESGADSRNLEQIGMECGFSGRAQFYRSFKKETGMSPGSFLRIAT